MVYIDEPGFDAYTYRPYAWSKRGQKSHGERNGKRGTRTSLIRGKTSQAVTRGNLALNAYCVRVSKSDFSNRRKC